MTTKKILLGAARLVTKGWTRDALARTKNGTGTFEEDPKAVRWCVLGALCRASRGEGVFDAMAAVNQEVGMDLVEWNNEVATSGKQVAAVLRRVAKRKQS